MYLGRNNSNQDRLEKLGIKRFGKDIQKGLDSGGHGHFFCSKLQIPTLYYILFSQEVYDDDDGYEEMKKYPSDLTNLGREIPR